MEMLLAPSLLGANPLTLKDTIVAVGPYASFFHIDIMDGQFVPNFAFGTNTLHAVSTMTKKPVEAHLMIKNPEKHIPLIAKAGACTITIHFEATKQPEKILQQIKKNKCKVGIALNPETPLSSIKKLWPFLDYLLLMGVSPGFGQQKFIVSVLSKISQARKHIDAHHLPVQLAVDGGINLLTGRKSMHAGADILVVGSALFKVKNIALQAEKFKKIK